jgi:FixJ family two-component response regulator
MSSSRILIVDDDPALLTALSGALKLRMADLDVETCDSALAAVKKITQTEYDAVVTDIKMPGMDGLALLKEIRTLRPELPTLLITGHGQHDLAVQALRGGAFDFIQKPIDREYVVASLSRAIRVRKLDRQLQQQQAALANHAAELEQAVEERTEQLRMANRRKDEFLATLSHELRNPLAPIRSGLEILKMEGKSDQEIIDLMQEQLLHLVRLVDDLMDTSRMMQGKIELRKESVDLLKLIDQSVKTIRPNIEARGQEFVSDLPKQPIWLHADPVRIVQII